MYTFAYEMGIPYGIYLIKAYIFQEISLHEIFCASIANSRIGKHFKSSCSILLNFNFQHTSEFKSVVNGNGAMQHKVVFVFE